MTKIKFCGLSRACDIAAANEWRPEYVGFVFAPKSRRYIEPAKAWELRRMLDRQIQAVGVFVREEPETVSGLLNSGLIDMAQLHGGEDDAYIRRLRELTDKPLIRAFRIDGEDDVRKAQCSAADYVLLDSGSGGTGTSFDWSLVRNIQRPYFLAGGLSADNVEKAVERLHPYAVDVSSGIETDGRKDERKMAAFVSAVRKGERV
ncbi:MAG: phosphoribosylanthranilate isomerase [bacterium]|nr:phosphoribosylanthranilate isomerase [bacterium]